MVFLEGKKKLKLKKIISKTSHFNETCFEQFEGTEKIVQSTD